MSPRIDEMDLLSVVGAASSGAARGFGRTPVGAMLFWGDHPESEVVHGEEFPDALRRALTTWGGRCVAEEVRRAGRPLRVRADALPREARELRAALAKLDLAELLVVPLMGESGVAGCVVLPSPTADGPLGDLEHVWRLASRSLQGLQLAAAASALSTALRFEGGARDVGFDGVLVIDRWERVILADGLFRAFPGWNREDPFGRSLDALPGVKILASLPMQQGLAPAWEEHLLPPIEGHGVPVALAGLPLVSAGGGDEWGKIVLLRDLRAEREDPASAGLLGLGMRVAHAVDQVASALSAKVAPVGALADLAGRLEVEIEAARGLVDQVLERCVAPEHRRTASMNDLLGEALARQKHELDLEGVRVFTFLRPDLPRAVGDPLALQRSVHTLVRSARESLRPAGGSLTVRTWQEDGWVYASISDDGAGRRGHDEERVGEPLFQSGGASRADELEDVRRVADGCSGKLLVESRPNVWTRNTLMLREERRRADRTVQVVETPRTEVERQVEGAGLAVLVVDDNAALRSVLRRYLERRGHSVTEAIDGDDGLRVVRGQRFDRLIVDIQMPGKSGPEFFEGLRGVAPSMRGCTIFMTGGFLEGDTERFITETGRPTIKKPFDLAEMARTVEDAAHESRA